MKTTIDRGGEKYFYPRPPRGGRLMSDYETTGGSGFLSTPSARRATRSLPIRLSGCPYFYPRPPRGGRRDPRVLLQRARTISIHALREEGDVSATSGEQTRSISIHALREEGDASLPEGLLRRSISIHALREEGDFSKVTYRAIRHHFYPRPPRGGRRRYSPLPQLGQANFYPRPPRGGRHRSATHPRTRCQFLSTPSARRATPASVGFAVAVFRFLSTPSARRATDNVDGAKRHRNISIHALREEGDGGGRLL